MGWPGWAWLLMSRRPEAVTSVRWWGVGLLIQAQIWAAPLVARTTLAPAGGLGVGAVVGLMVGVKVRVGVLVCVGVGDGVVVAVTVGDAVIVAVALAVAVLVGIGVLVGVPPKDRSSMGR